MGGCASLCANSASTSSSVVTAARSGSAPSSPASVTFAPKAITPVVDASALFEGERTVAVVDVYDGDTLTVEFPFADRRVRARCRVGGIDAPEMRPPLANADREEEKRAAVAARDRARDLVLGGMCHAHIGRQDKYGRLLIRLRVPEGLEAGQWLGDVLVREHLAVPYDGGRKAPMRFEGGRVCVAMS